jgi:hypothetical protein
MLPVSRMVIPLSLEAEFGGFPVNPQHITAALAVLYMDDKGGRVHITRDILLDAQARLHQYEITIIENEIWVQEK